MPGSPLVPQIVVRSVSCEAYHSRSHRLAGPPNALTWHLIHAKEAVRQEDFHLSRLDAWCFVGKIVKSESARADIDQLTRPGIRGSEYDERTILDLIPLVSSPLNAHFVLRHHRTSDSYLRSENGNVPNGKQIPCHLTRSQVDPNF